MFGLKRLDCIVNFNLRILGVQLTCSYKQGKIQKERIKVNGKLKKESYFFNLYIYIHNKTYINFSVNYSSLKKIVLNRKEIIDNQFDQYTNKYLKDTRPDRFEKIKEYLIQIISFDQYDKYVNVF
jgi:hypothetical protein